MINMIKTQKRILCPNCKKPRLVPFIGFQTGSYECQNCGYVGPVFVEEIKNTGKNQKTGRKNKNTVSP